MPFSRERGTASRDGRLSTCPLTVSATWVGAHSNNPVRHPLLKPCVVCVQEARQRCPPAAAAGSGLSARCAAAGPCGVRRSGRHRVRCRASSSPSPRVLPQPAQSATCSLVARWPRTTPLLLAQTGLHRDHRITGRDPLGPACVGASCCARETATWRSPLAGHPRPSRDAPLRRLALRGPFVSAGQLLLLATQMHRQSQGSKPASAFVTADQSRQGRGLLRASFAPCFFRSSSTPAMLAPTTSPSCRVAGKREEGGVR